MFIDSTAMGSEEWHTTHTISLTDHYTVCVYVSRQREQDQTNIPTLLQIQYKKGQSVDCYHIVKRVFSYYDMLDTSWSITSFCGQIFL